MCDQATYNRATLDQATYEQTSFTIKLETKLPETNDIRRIHVATSNYKQL